MADRVGVIDKGRILLVDDKDAIMAKLGRTEAIFSFDDPLTAVPACLDGLPVQLEEGGGQLVYRGGDGTGKGKREVAEIARLLTCADIAFTGLDTRESSLEDIFVGLVKESQAPGSAAA